VEREKVKKYGEIYIYIHSLRAPQAVLRPSLKLERGRASQMRGVSKKSVKHLKT
jgi:hypothetical protein